MTPCHITAGKNRKFAVNTQTLTFDLGSTIARSPSSSNSSPGSGDFLGVPGANAKVVSYQQLILAPTKVESGINDLGSHSAHMHRRGKLIGHGP